MARLLDERVRDAVDRELGALEPDARELDFFAADARELDFFAADARELDFFAADARELDALDPDARELDFFAPDARAVVELLVLRLEREADGVACVSAARSLSKSLSACLLVLAASLRSARRAAVTSL